MTNTELSEALIRLETKLDALAISLAKCQTAACVRRESVSNLTKAAWAVALTSIGAGVQWGLRSIR